MNTSKTYIVHIKVMGKPWKRFSLPVPAPQPVKKSRGALVYATSNKVNKP